MVVWECGDIAGAEGKEVDLSRWGAERVVSEEAMLIGVYNSHKQSEGRASITQKQKLELV